MAAHGKGQSLSLGDCKARNTTQPQVGGEQVSCGHSFLTGRIRNLTHEISFVKMEVIFERHHLVMKVKATQSCPILCDPKYIQIYDYFVCVMPMTFQSSLIVFNVLYGCIISVIHIFYCLAVWNSIVCTFFLSFLMTGTLILDWEIYLEN